MPKQLEIVPYSPALEKDWDALIERSVNGTFLQTRRFLGYHGDRFDEASAGIQDDGGRLVGIFPAARLADEVIDSHPGLTHAGLIHDGSLRGEVAVDILSRLCSWYRERGARRLDYKAIPFVFRRLPSADDAWALQQIAATRYRCDLSAIVDLQDRPRIKDGRRDDLRKARKRGITVSFGMEFLAEFWAVLERVVAERHASKPVHSLAEIQELAGRFPSEITLVTAQIDQVVLAGALLFKFAHAAHTQYLASNTEGQGAGALTLVAESAIENARSEGKRWFSFGTSTLDGGRSLNAGLYEWKASFGATGLVHDFYTVELGPT